MALVHPLPATSPPELPQPDHNYSGVSEAERVLQQAASRLRTVIGEPEKFSVDTVLADNGALASAFHGLLSSQSVGSGISQGWSHEEWGPQMLAWSADSYRLMTDALLRVSTATAQQLEKESGAAKIERLQSDVRKGIEYLRRYKQSGMPVDVSMFIELQERAGAASLSVPSKT